MTTTVLLLNLGILASVLRTGPGTREQPDCAHLYRHAH